MKRMKKMIAFLLTIVLFLSSAPVELHAAETKAAEETVISVENKYTVAEETVEVNVLIQNNPGILGATLEIAYPEGLSLVGASEGEAFSYLTMTKPARMDSPCRFTWDGTECGNEDLKDGAILTLEFKVTDQAVLKEAMPVTVTIPDGDIYDNNLQYVSVKTEAGSVTLLDFKPGDVNEDQVINTTDIIVLRRYLVGYNIELNENAANVNDDGKVNTADVILLRRYIAGGYDVELLYPTVLKCEHQMEATAYKAPTCTEEGNNNYWYCTSCHKYFSDVYGNHEITMEDIVIPETGHTPVTIPGTEPDYDHEGLTEGIYCSVCKKTLKEQEVIKPLEKDEYSITYYVTNNDTYLAGLDIKNENPNVYTKQDGLKLQDLVVDGYYFKGWYTAATGGEKVTEIAKGTEGNQTLYAQWEEVVYKVHFDSPDVPIEAVTYTVSTGVTLTNPSWFGYTFIGWSDDDGFIVSRIKPGTVGNITLHANWTSNRNKATSYASYEKPAIVEDDINGRFLFIYDIGKIENVPLSEIDYIGNTQTLDITKEYTITDTVTEETAETITNMVSNATTRSSAWTLSENWDQVYSEGSGYEDEQIKTTERTDSEGNTVGGKYFVSNSTGGSSYMSTECGGSSATSSKVTTDTSKGINSSYDNSTETYADAKLSAENKLEAGASYSTSVGLGKASAEVKNTTTVSGEVSSGRKDNTSYHVDSSYSSNVGTVDTNDESSYFNVSANQSSTWNSTSGYESSYETTRDTAVTNAVSEAIKKTTSYSVSNALGGENSSTESVGGTDTRSDEYSSTMKYSKGTATTTKKTISYNSDRPGYYRIVTAGTVHVYGVVGYDVATASYFTYSMSVLDDKTYEYLDYSMSNANFNDCENGLVTFEVPFEVFEYVSYVTGKTNGLVFELDGTVSEFNEKEDAGFDGTVIIPEYYSTNNTDGTYSAYKTTAFDNEVFKGNTEIKKVVLPMYITEIPDNAFEGCTNLEMVVAYGVTKIGANAFKGCTSLKSFSADNLITEIGENAFEDVTELKVMAANSEVADAALASGAKRITLNLSKMTDSYNHKKIEISDDTEYFALISDGRSYENLQIESNAAETYLSNLKFTGNEDTPLDLNSEKVTLARVTVENAPGFAMILRADHTDLALYGTIAMSSAGEDVVISKNVSLSKANQEVSGKLQLAEGNGNYLVCGSLTTDKKYFSGVLKTIDETEFNRRLTSTTLTFDANGGTVEEGTRTLYYGQTYGTLPVPEREYHTFLGWYTSAEGGKQITEESVVEVLGKQTLYAQWELNHYTVEFDANGGNVEETSRIIACGESLGVLPVPERIGYDFNGWFTEDGEQITETTMMSEETTVTVFARWSSKAYTVSWNNGTGYTIRVERTSSPYADAATGTLSNGAVIYYGDILKVTYSASNGYSLTGHGVTEVTVTESVESNQIYASASANSYTYTILYRSTNGTDLGSSSATYKYGTTNTISAPGKSGYNTPGSQTVAWDSTSGKTIAFYYSPVGQATSQWKSGGNWYVWNSGKYGITYNAYAEYQNRTAGSVQIRITWTNTMLKNSYYGFAQYFTGNIGGTSTGQVQIASASLWNSASSSNRTATVSSGWITVPVSATQTSVSVSATYKDGNGVSGSWSGSIAIPTY